VAGYCEPLGGGGDGSIDAPPDACTTCAPGDQDGDGVKDSDDNCPAVANATQDDEDGDGLGDVCDPCPVAANNADSDSDGVGDACDPNPGVSGDKIVAFAGFAHGLPGAPWVVTGSVVAMAGDAVATAPAMSGALLMYPEPATGSVTVVSDGELDAYASMTVPVGLGVAARHSDGTDNSVACQLVGQQNDLTLQKLRLYDSSLNMVVNEVDHSIVPGTRSTLTLHRTGTSYTCAATMPGATATGASSLSVPSPQIGLRMRSGTGRYHWVMVITSP
jgi:hypothetical protein